MKKIILFCTSIFFVSCIGSFVEEFMGVKAAKYFSTETSNLIIDNPKAVYNVGDTLKLRYVFLNKFKGVVGKESVKDNYFTDIHQTYPHFEQELFTYRYKSVPNVSQLIKDGQEIDSYRETLLYDEASNTYFSQPILLVLKSEGIYDLDRLVYVPVFSNVIKIENEKKFNSIMIELKNNVGTKIEVRP